VGEAILSRLAVDARCSVPELLRFSNPQFIKPQFIVYPGSPAHQDILPHAGHRRYVRLVWCCSLIGLASSERANSLLRFDGGASYFIAGI